MAVSQPGGHGVERNDGDSVGPIRARGEIPALSMWLNAEISPLAG